VGGAELAGGGLAGVPGAATVGQCSHQRLPSSDGTKIHANASRDGTLITSRSRARSSRTAKATDAAEDELYGAARGDELPAEFATEHRRRGWLRDAKQRLDERRAKEAKPIPRSRPERLEESKRRLEEEHPPYRRHAFGCCRGLRRQMCD
jgi:hypothetical protein